MRTIIIQNNTGSDRTYAGQFIADTTSYTIQSETEREQFSKDTQLNVDLWAGDTTINDGTSTLSAADGDKWLKNLTQSPTDTDGVPLARAKITQSGWHFQYHSVEWETAKLNSIFNQDPTGQDLGFSTIKFYDSNDNELIAGTQAELTSSCVKTVLDFEPTHDIEVIGGTLYQSDSPTSDIRLWIVAAPDVPKANGGSVEFTQGGLNLRRLGVGNVIELDGKTPKLMSYDATYHTSKFRFTVTHGAGVNFPMFMGFKLFKSALA